MNIAIESKKSDGAERLLQVTVPVDVVDQAKHDAARKLAAKVTIPGFRPGKAPAAMVLKRFGPAIRDEALQSIVNDAFQEVVSREQLKLATQPHVHDVKFEDGTPLTFELHLEVRPEVTLARTQGFRVTRTLKSLTDDDVREQIETLREQKATWAPVDGKPMEGDQVTVKLATADEGSEVPEAREYPLVLGAGQAIPGIEEVIMDLAPGETVERVVKWPDDFPDEAQRSKSKTVRVTLHEVKRKELPPLDDDFARSAGDFDSVEQLQQAVRADMEDAARRESDADVRQKLLDEIIGANAFDIPPSWVAQLIQAYAQNYRIPEEEHERFAVQFRPMAERQVRRDLVIETLAESESLKASEADVDEKVTELAAKRGVNPGQLYASLQKAQRLSEIERGLTEDKVFAWLTERNTIE
jgi:trigger factor